MIDAPINQKNNGLTRRVFLKHIRRARSAETIDGNCQIYWANNLKRIEAIPELKDKN